MTQSAFHRERPLRACTRRSNLAHRLIDNAQDPHTVSPSLVSPLASGGGTSFLRASAALPQFVLRLAGGARRAMRSTDVCLPNSTLRAPVPRVFLVSSRGFHLVRAKRALGLASLTQGDRRFTTPKPLRRIVIGAFLRGGECLAAAWALSSHDDDAIEPLASLSPPSIQLEVAHLRAQLRAGESRQDRFHRASVKRFGLIGPRCLPSTRTLRVFQSPLRRWARDRRTPFWKMFRPLRGACHTTLGLGRSRSVLAPRPDSRHFFA